MRRLLLCCLPFVLGGCTLLGPSHDPSQAWIDLYSDRGETVEAVGVDERSLDDDDYFQVSPGAHALQMRVRFEVAPGNVGIGDEPLPRTCLMTLDYADFAAGKRYRVRTGSRGFRPWAQLYGADGERLARAREGRCGDV